MLEDWSEFFVAAAGASAALAGLIIVAMSVSIERLIEIPGMTSRAASAISLLVAGTLISLAGLIPHQGPVAFGVEALVLGLASLAFTVDSLVRLIRASRLVRESRPQAFGEAIVKGSIGVVPSLLFVAGAVMIMAGLEAGLGLVAAGVLASFAVAVIDGWVMLVEIRR